MKVLIFLVMVLVASARAQIPSLGFCPEYLPMAGFDMDRFSGIWYEAERYFQLTEVASRCVMSNYTKGPDGKFRVLNEVTSRFTGIKRVLEGEIRKAPSKAEEGKLQVKYTTVPLIPLETQYNVLETDYENYAVMWSCAGIGPVHTQNAWIMTRQRIAPGEILQKAYGVLDKYKISKVFFVKTNQDDCLYLDSLQAEQTANRLTTEVPEKNVEDEEEENPEVLTKSAVDIRPITPDAPEAIIKTRKAEEEAKEAKKIEEEKKAEVKEPIVEAPEPIAAPAEETVKSVPEVIMKIAEEAIKLEKEAAREPVKEQKAKEPIIEPVKEETKTEEEPKEKSATPVEQEKKQEVVEEKIEIVKP